MLLNSTPIGALPHLCYHCESNSVCKKRVRHLDLQALALHILGRWGFGLRAQQNSDNHTNKCQAIDFQRVGMVWVALTACRRRQAEGLVLLPLRSGPGLATSRREREVYLAHGGHWHASIPHWLRGRHSAHLPAHD
jgi:hypothetical protein